MAAHLYVDGTAARTTGVAYGRRPGLGSRLRWLVEGTRLSLSRPRPVALVELLLLLLELLLELVRVENGDAVHGGRRSTSASAGYRDNNG